MKKTKKAVEKYIYRREYSSGSVAFELWIRKGGQEFHETFNVSDFAGSEREALDTARKKKNEILYKIDTEKPIEDKTLPTVHELYIKSYELIPVKYQTRARHDIYFRKVLDPYKDIPINKITVAMIQKSVNDYAEKTEDNRGNKGHNRKETGKMLAVWRRIYKTALMMEYEISDKTAAVRIPEGKPAKHRKTDLSMDDFNLFCKYLLKYNQASISGAYDCRAVYYSLIIMLFTGLRPAETYALKRSDVDLDNMTISINSAVGSDLESYPVVAGTKTEQSIRKVPISPQLADVLRECLDWSQNDIILSRYRGELLTSRWMNTLKRNIIKSYQLDIDFRPYQLRHQLSTDLFRSGVAAPTIRDLMGHSGAGMTLDYATSSAEDRKKAVSSRQISIEKESKN